MVGRVGGFLIAVALAGSAAGPALAADLFEGVRGKIRAGLSEHGVPSMSIAVARDGKIIWEEAFGFADVERRVKATPRTMYSLASISKPFTATGLMILVERGLVDLDRPLNDYLGKAKIQGLAGDASAATPRRVGSHTSGLPLHYQFYMADESYPLPSMEEAIRRYGILVAKPGERYQYSNIGFGILGYAIGRVSGKSYEQFMREEVFEPLGLEDTEIPSAAPARPWAVRYWDENRALPFYDFDHRGASAVFASAHDLARFGMLHVKTPMRGTRNGFSPASRSMRCSGRLPGQTPGSNTVSDGCSIPTWAGCGWFTMEDRWEACGRSSRWFPKKRPWSWCWQTDIRSSWMRSGTKSCR